MVEPLQPKTSDLAHNTGSSGLASVGGTNSTSTLTTSGSLYVGYGNSATGTLNVTSGGSVSVGDSTYVGYGGSNMDSAGTITFNGGTLSTRSLFVSPTQLTGSGTGTIATRGLVSDRDLTFDGLDLQNHGLTQRASTRRLRHHSRHEWKLGLRWLSARAGMARVL